MLLWFFLRAEERNRKYNYEKQRLLEIRYPTGDISFDSCTDSHQHNIVHGTWSYLHVNDIPPYRGIVYLWDMDLSICKTNYPPKNWGDSFL